MACVSYSKIGGGSIHGLHKSKPPKSIRLVKWEAPVAGTFKVNVDGSSLGNPGKAGIGGLIRDVNGKWIVGFAGFVGFNTILVAELTAIKEGLELAWKKGCRKVICETDSSEALQLVEWAKVEFHMYGVVIEEIRKLLQNDWEVNLVHVLREGNQCADYLAKLGSRNRYSLHTWNFPLPQLQSQLANDAVGVLYCRN